MPDSPESGGWLLVDAAGPDLIVGIMRSGRWLDRVVSNDGFLESLKPAVESLLARNHLTLESLAGCIHAEGPGSTLGLRLAAMFLASLLQLEPLLHWRCFSYNNLALACAATAGDGNSAPCRMAAPWRRDRLHVVEFMPATAEVAYSFAEPDDVAKAHIPCVRIGNRATRLPDSLTLLAYPADRIPETLRRFPGLLTFRTAPRLFVAEEPSFVRWDSRRHGSP